MLFLENLFEKECIKLKNVFENVEDNSTWSLSGSITNPPRIVVGSNSHKISVFNLQNGSKTSVDAHQHNIPCVHFSPCGKFIATTSIDRSVKIWAEMPKFSK
jgi:WD40 repeat protein